ncbi:MAG TPA: ATP synthase F1 subunit epsilon [Saprospiraceae bacterium]|nr:ATP synthase F1 subunit epsilon [Saprospiraceae bacterium]MCC6688709.1 ATP synthase F1 subunit epsilon [Saprospiraceae bacterium]HMV23308.1 ATP synthase F1 subunit epsilon [Saprospiraceae bacterium]HMW75080.1 ATP synthase F1 subunit epsilon [Saprospiraceae bacterium]HMX82098.1 ATP synthase F1 subunit epsilon [Saprospiraceae bacterium]
MLKLIVLTPESEYFQGNVKSVKVPGVSGQFEILANHAALLSALSKGKVRIIKEDGQKETFEIESGFIEVLRNEVALLVRGISN